MNKKKIVITALIAIALLVLMLLASNLFNKSQTAEEYTQKVYAAVSPKELLH